MSLLAYDGDFCQNDADGCREIECFNNSQCTDNIAPDVGGTCPPCPSGFTGNGTICAGMFCYNKRYTNNFFVKMLMNVPI